jgi:ankyrin repeat protein
MKFFLLLPLLLAFGPQSSSAVDSELHNAVRNNNIVELRTLLSMSLIRQKIDIAEPILGWTPLHLAIVLNCVSCAKLLLNAGANPLVHDYSGKIPLSYAFGISDPQIRGLIIYRLFEAMWNR